jgi:2'-5' RNA ligase
VTLAYLKPTVRDDRLAAWIQGHNLLQSPPFRLDHFGLYSSVTGPQGGIYMLEKDYPL